MKTKRKHFNECDNLAGDDENIAISQRVAVRIERRSGRADECVAFLDQWRPQTNNRKRHRLKKSACGKSILELQLFRTCAFQLNTNARQRRAKKTQNFSKFPRSFAMADKALQLFACFQINRNTVVREPRVAGGIRRSKELSKKQAALSVSCSHFTRPSIFSLALQVYSEIHNSLKFVLS